MQAKDQIKNSDLRVNSRVFELNQIIKVIQIYKEILMIPIKDNTQ